MAFYGDNTNCNGKNRKGIHDDHAKLNIFVGWTLIRIGCGAHIIHNTIITAADYLIVDFECINDKMYSFFHFYCVRVKALREFSHAADTEYKKLLGYNKTR